MGNVVMTIVSGSFFSFVNMPTYDLQLLRRLLVIVLILVLFCFVYCSPHGIFHLSDPGGVSVLRNCQQRGFHPHEEPEDGSPIYEHCSHVYMNPKLMFDVIDLR